MRTVVSSVLLAIDQGLRMEEILVKAGLNFIHNTRFKIHVERTRYMLAGRSLGEESTEAIVLR